MSPRFGVEKNVLLLAQALGRTLRGALDSSQVTRLPVFSRTPMAPDQDGELVSSHVGARG